MGLRIGWRWQENRQLALRFGNRQTITNFDCMNITCEMTKPTKTFLGEKKTYD